MVNPNDWTKEKVKVELMFLRLILNKKGSTDIKCMTSTRTDDTFSVQHLWMGKTKTILLQAAFLFIISGDIRGAFSTHEESPVFVKMRAAWVLN